MLANLMPILSSKRNLLLIGSIVRGLSGRSQNLPGHTDCYSKYICSKINCLSRAFFRDQVCAIDYGFVIIFKMFHCGALGSREELLCAKDIPDRPMCSIR